MTRSVLLKGNAALTGQFDEYRYNEFDKKADSLRIIEDQKRQRKIDSIENVQKTLDSIRTKSKTTMH